MTGGSHDTVHKGLRHVQGGEQLSRVEKVVHVDS